jgi:hypothetical protein
MCKREVRSSAVTALQSAGFIGISGKEVIRAKLSSMTTSKTRIRSRQYYFVAHWY